jgi:hypothetical protein
MMRRGNPRPKTGKSEITGDSYPAATTEAPTEHSDWLPTAERKNPRI